MNATPAIDIKDVFYTYPDGSEALRGVSLRIDPGESVAVMGANGAGKSTLILTLPGLVEASGTITVSGIRLSRKTARDIRKKIGIVFQNPEDQLFCPTVFDDVAFGPKNMGLDDDAVNLLVTSALSSMMLDGFDHRSAHHLSFGEKKRAAIATILSMEPDIIVFDEPTANLDPEGVFELKRIIRSIEKTKLIVTHDITLAAALTERSVVMSDGMVACDMPTEHLLADTSLLKKLRLVFD
ncbi:MAG: ABC transporter ATP-binding protein [Deltaproteobacteria bacterium]|nr:ABC transporter ATP-binding protein [Candidatus Zymogenaceae bacterium]